MKTILKSFLWAMVIMVTWVVWQLFMFLIDEFVPAWIALILNLLPAIILLTLVFYLIYKWKE